MDTKKKKNKKKMQKHQTNTAENHPRRIRRPREDPNNPIYINKSRGSKCIDPEIVDMRQHQRTPQHSHSTVDWDAEFDSYNEARKLREENLKLKRRLKAANNTIRDLEHVCNRAKEDNNILYRGEKHSTDGTTPNTKLFCSFLLPKKPAESSSKFILPKKPAESSSKVGDEIDYHSRRRDDLSVFSSSVFSASTVKTGSVTRSKKKNSRNVTITTSRRKQMNKPCSSTGSSDRRHPLNNHQSGGSCFDSFITRPTPSLKVKNHDWMCSSSSSIEIENDVETETAPCSQDRSPSARTRLHQVGPLSSRRHVIKHMERPLSYVDEDDDDEEEEEEDDDDDDDDDNLSRMNLLMDDSHIAHFNIRTYQSPTFNAFQMDFPPQAAMKTIPLNLMHVENSMDRHQHNSRTSFERSRGGGSSGVKGGQQQAALFSTSDEKIESSNCINIGRKNRLTMIREVDCATTTDSTSSYRQIDEMDQEYRIEI